jgi:hypothetical protein
MRVFCVRPSDNGNYGIEEALRALPTPPERLDLALFRGLRLPLQALDYDPHRHGLADLSGYDVVVLAGVDPVALSSRECLELVAFVERGGGLLLVGGTHSFSNAVGTYLPLAPLLPVEIRRGLDVEVNALPHGTSHPIARGLPEPLGYVSKVHAIELKPGAAVALTVGEFPLVVTGEWGYGRVVVVASYPECHEAEYGWFFTGDAFDDFLRAALAWLLKEQADVWVESFSLPSREVTTGSESFGKLLLHASRPTSVTITTTLAREGREVYKDSTHLHVEGAHETLFSFRAPKGPDAGGLYYAAVAVADAEKREVARRDVAVAVQNPTRVSLEFEYGRRCFAPGDPVRLRAHAFSDRRSAPPEVALDVWLLDPDGAAVHKLDRRVLPWRGSAYEDADLEFALPPVRPGTYRLRAELRTKNDLADVADEPLHVLAAPRTADTFPLIAEGAAHLDRPSIERAVATLARLGVSVLSLPGPGTTPWGERPHREAMLTYAEEQAARAGLGIAHHRRGLVPGFAPSAPLEPCALAKDYHRALKSLARPILEADSRVHGLVAHEVVPQTAVTPQQLCHCGACAAKYRDAFQGELPEPPKATELAGADRHALHSFVSSYWWTVYAMVEKLREKVAPGVKLSLPFTAASFLRENASAPYCDAISWARAADVVEVQAEADLARYRLSLAGHRSICQAEGKKLGAVIELGNRALPPAEAAFTALVHGAESLRVADNPRFALWADRPPIEDALGDLFRRLRHAAPLLAHGKRPKARLALVFPFTQMVDQGTPDLLAAHELLCDAFGEVDLIHQRHLTDEGLADYKAVALLGTRTLRQKMQEALLGFVERGGVLLADSPDLRDQDSQPLPWPAGFFGETEEPLYGAVTVCYGHFSQGHTVLFSPNAARTYLTARAADDPQAVRFLCRTIAGLLACHVILPRARSDNPAIEVALRTVPGTALLIAVNHCPYPEAANVVLDMQAIPHGAAYNLLTGEEQWVVTDSDGPRMFLALDGHDAGLWMLCDGMPEALRVEPLSSVARGGEARATLHLTDGDGKPAESSPPLRVLVLDPAGRERPELGGERLAVGGFGVRRHDAAFFPEIVIPIALNDPPGRWTLCVTEPLTGLAARATFEVEGPQAKGPSGEA